MMKSIRRALFLGALLVALSGCAHGLQTGTEALEAGELERAEAIAASELERDASSPWANLLMAEVRFEHGNHRDALAYALRADRSQEYPIRSGLLVGQIRAALDQPVDAAAAFHRVYELDPDALDLETYVSTLVDAIAFVSLRRDSEREFQLRRRLQEVAPDHPEASPQQIASARRALAATLRQRGAFLDAARLLEEALQGDPALLTREALELGEVYARLEMPEDAVESWEVYLDADDLPAEEALQRHMDVADLASRFELFQVAVDVLTRARPLMNPIQENAALLEIATYQFRSEDTSGAQRSLNEFLAHAAIDRAEGSYDAGPYRQAAELAMRLGQPRVAINILQRGVVEATPSRTLTRDLADIYARRAQMDSVEEVLDLFIERLGDDLEALLFAGGWAADRSNYDLAHHYYQQVTELDDVPAPFWLDLAAVLYEIDDHDGLVQAVHTFLTNRDHSNDAIDRAISFYTRISFFDEAEPLLRRLLQDNPTSRDLTARLAALYRQWSRPERVAPVWEEWIQARGNRPEDIEQVAQALLSSGDLERSAHFFRRAAEAGRHTAWLNAADVYLRQDHTAAMSSALDSYLEVAPDRAAALDHVSTRYRRAGMESRYLEVLTELSELQPSNWRVFQALTSLLLERGQTEEVLTALRRYADASIDPFDALENASNRLGSHFPPSLLIELYRPYSEEPDPDPRIFRLLADAYYSMHNQSDRSEEYLRQARALYEQFLDASEGENIDWRALGMDLNQRGMWRPAARAFQRYIDQGGRQVYATAYAETLLRLGEADQAETLLREHFQNQGRRPDVAGRIARLLKSHHRYDAAEEFARHLMQAGDDASLQDGFIVLAGIYVDREDQAGLQNLIAEYPRRAGNRVRARRVIVDFLEAQGLYDDAAEQLAEIPESVVDPVPYRRGINLFRLGEVDASFREFETAASRSVSPGTTWAEIGDFYAAHGQSDTARRAYDRAVQIAPDNLTVRRSRAIFFIYQGDFDAAWEDYEFARRSGAAFDSAARVQLFDALLDVGHARRALQVRNDMLADGVPSPASLDNTISGFELRSQDEAVWRPALQRLQSRAWGVGSLIGYLHDSGRHDEVFSLIAEEFDYGDPNTAAIYLLNRAPEVARVADWTAQERHLHSIVDPLQRADTRLVGAVGDHLNRLGQVESSRTYLQAAVDFRNEDYRSMLGAVLLSQGDRDAAMDHFERWIELFPEPSALESVLLRFELAGDSDGAVLFLDRIADNPRLQPVALPKKVLYDVERHADPARAVDDLLVHLADTLTLPSRSFAQRGDQQAFLSREELARNTLIASMEAIAALGHLDLVEETLDRDDLPVATDGRHLTPLRLRLALGRDDLDEASRLAQELIDAAEDGQRRQELRLSLARRFVAFGAYEPARAIVDDALASQTSFRDHDAMVLSMGLHLLMGEEEHLTAAIETYLDRVPNRLEARRTLIDELRRLGRDAETIQLIRATADRHPTASLIRQGLVAAINLADVPLTREFTEKFVALGDNPYRDLLAIAERRVNGTEPILILPVIDALREIRPAALTPRLLEIQVLFRGGHIDEAREALLSLHADTGAHRDSTAEIVELLASEQLDIELARVLAPELTDDALWPRTIIRIAEAEVGLGFPDRASTWLDRLDSSAENPGLWRLELGDRLAKRQRFDQIPLALSTFSDNDLPPHGLYLRALHHLATGDEEQAQQAVEDLRRANATGVGRYRSHYFGVQASLAGDCESCADTLIGEMMSIPTRDSNSVSVPLQLVLRAAMHQPGGPEAIRRFLEEHRPRLVDGQGVTWTQFAGQLAGAFEQTGDPEGAYGFYRDRIWQSLFVREDDRSLPVYLNNLAYTYSTTDRHIDRGLDKITRSIVLAGERNASYIDTLGWLLYRTGDLEAAEAEIRRALREYDGPPSGLRELYSHLAIILTDRGVYDEAAWLHVYLHRLALNDIEW